MEKARMEGTSILTLAIKYSSEIILCLMHRQRKCKQFFDKWLGPCDIKEITSPTSYILDRKFLEAYNVHNLKPYYPREELASVNSVPAKDSPHGTNVQAYEPPATRRRHTDFKKILGIGEGKKKKG